MSPTKQKHTTKKSAPKAAVKVALKPAPKPVKEKPITAVKVRRSLIEGEREVHALEPSQLTRTERPQLVAAGQGEGNEGRYVYGVIQVKDPLSFGKIGMGGTGEMVYTVHHGDIAGVVSRSPVFIFDPTRENALAHEHVIETVMKGQTIIPMSFGTVFRTDDDIREVLKSIYPSLKDVLKQMANKLEFGLKVTWDRDQIIEELKRQHEDIHRFHQEITRKHLQSTYFARMQLGRMIDKALVERAADYVREIYEALRPVCVASRDNKPIGDKMIMNAAFLIHRDKEPDFDEAVNKIAQRFGDRLNFKYTGPWPPYNFVNIRLKLERGTAS
ncbi:MAG: GvpL/GvpF family gas vesicle protein [Candidatus Koribacter versatilis]|uniref:GvpL/GvpF family gas vesicle protein n=1 Tax=Candidatus Korobacter versatilis TaxID=658062 RepID=A0A932A5S2_9BACT|nr:GvpL/GvpF family gas vesicle protein [Candidatus Koribacter versatilis]